MKKIYQEPSLLFEYLNLRDVLATSDGKDTIEGWIWSEEELI